MTPQTAQGAALKKDRCPNPWPVVNCVFHDIENYSRRQTLTPLTEQLILSDNFLYDLRKTFF
jgi:hypothetical protein